MTAKFDVIVAGGGVAGVLLASRIHRQSPDKTIAIVDQGSELGGRLRSSDPSKGRWSYGLNSVSQQLIEFLDTNFRSDPANHDRDINAVRQRQSLGVLAAGKIETTALASSFSKQGARAIAGAAAARDWSRVDELTAKLEDKARAEQNLAKSWSGTRKCPAAIVLQHLTRLFGIADFWTSSDRQMIERWQEFRSSQHTSDWQSLLNSLVYAGCQDQKISVNLDTNIANARYQDKLWTLSTTKGDISGDRLAVAQSPWDALMWLPKSYWPSRLVAVTNKAKPTSLVTLTERITSGDPKLPDTILVPAESIQVIVDGATLCFQATLAYEVSLSAPEVLKAVKRLRRARSKLLAVFADVSSEEGHIALLSAAWTQPTSIAERRVLARLEGQKFQQDHLVFCGDTYGPGLFGDNNLIQSVIKASEVTG